MWLNVMATSHTHAERLAPVPPCTLTATHNIHTHEALSLDWCYDLFVSVVAFTWVKIPHLIFLSFSPGVCLGVIDGLGVLCLFPCGRWLGESGLQRGFCGMGQLLMVADKWAQWGVAPSSCAPIQSQQHRKKRLMSSPSSCHSHGMCQMPRYSGTTWFKGKIDPNVKICHQLLTITLFF